MKESIFNIKTEKEYIKLKNKVNINEVDSNGDNALFRFDLFGGESNSRAKWLIKHGINIHHVNNRGRNALWIVDYEDGKVLVDAGIDINHIDNIGQNALFGIPPRQLTELLIDRGININHLDNDGNNVITYCYDEDFVNLLISKEINLSHFRENPDCINKISYLKIREMIMERLIQEEKGILLKVIDTVKPEQKIKRS